MTKSEIPAAAVPVEIPLRDIGEAFGRFRLVEPKAQARLDTSIKTYGQLSPVIVLASGGAPFELLDGFKRLRAVRSLDPAGGLRAVRLTFGQRAAKAAVLEINRATCRVSDFEEALVLQSLSRDDGLTQVEIGALFGKNQSWVSRRIGLAERLSEEAKELIRLGLLSFASGRELMPMPRGIQPMLLETLQKHAMTSREVHRLVVKLQATPKEQWAEVLRFPDEALSGETQGAKLSGLPPFASLSERFVRLAAHCQTVKREVAKTEETIPEGSDAAETGEHLIKVMTWTVKSVRQSLRTKPGGAGHD